MTLLITKTNKMKNIIKISILFIVSILSSSLLLGQSVDNSNHCDKKKLDTLIAALNWGSNDYDSDKEIKKEIYAFFLCKDSSMRIEAKRFMVKYGDTLTTNELFNQLENSNYLDPLIGEVIASLFGLYGTNKVRFEHYAKILTEIGDNSLINSKLRLKALHLLDRVNLNVESKSLFEIIWNREETIFNRLAAFNIVLNGNQRKKNLITQLDSLNQSKNIDSELKGEILLSLGENFDYLKKYRQLSIQEQSKIKELIECSIKSSDTILSVKALKAKNLIKSID
jgi:hypothetical protein